jgi:RHS repeat-associated protein
MPIRRSTLTLPNGIVTTYGYDDGNQLTSLTYTSGLTTLGTLTYGYDAAGHRTTVGGTWARTGLPQPVVSATYDAANRIAAWAGQPLSYDANGNLASDGLASYTWNARNQLTSLSGALNGSFAYDAQGRRRVRTTSGTTSYLYDGANAAQELVGGNPTANILTGGVDEVFQRTDSAGASAVLTDALGSTVALADGSGAVQTQYTYEPFGATTSSGAASANPAQYTGRENDGTGLYFNRARFYSPSLQRWISEDPIEFAGGDINLYAHVGSQPTMWRDADGLAVLSLPPGHPCAWPPNGGSKSKSDDQPPPEPPLTWWLMCSPTVVPDLLPIPLARPGGTGLPHVRGPFLDLKPHPFPIIGPQPHIQINIWFDGVPGIQIPIRIPLPGWPWW